MRALVLAGFLLSVALAGCGDSGFVWPEPKEPRAPVYGLEGVTLEPMDWGGFEFPTRVRGDGAGGQLVVTQEGKIWHIVDGERQRTPWLDLSKKVSNCHLEQGMLDLVLDGAGRAYVTYTSEDNCRDGYFARRGDVVLSRFTVTDQGARDEEVLLRIEKPNRNHNGGGMEFGPDDYLYLGVGDGGGHGDPFESGQDPTDLLGTILRLDVSGATGYAVPSTNPYADGQQGAPEVFHHGLRNPWRFAFDAEAFEGGPGLWIADVGQACFEEVDLVPATNAGRNFGWSVYEGAHPYTSSCQDAPGPDPADVGPMTFPVFEYGHDEGCSITGGLAVRDAGPLQGTYLFSDWCSGVLHALRWNGTAYAAETVMDTGLQPTSFGQDDAGTVYITNWGSTDTGGAGSIHRLVF